jgi:hypothetical protein
MDFERQMEKYLADKFDRLTFLYDEYVGSKIEHLTCPEHDEKIASRQTTLEQGGISTKFFACCEKLEELAAQVVKKGLDEGELHMSVYRGREEGCPSPPRTDPD